MLSLPEILLYGFRTCPSCGSFGARESLLCRPCEAAILETAGLLFEDDLGFPVRSLFNWIPGESDRLSRLLLALKGPYREASWRWWAQRFLDVHGPWLAPQMRLLSAPSGKKNRSGDHSLFWARGFSQGQEFYGRAFARDGQKQRRRGRQARLQRTQLTSVKKLPRGSGLPWVLADDVVTTGATALAIFEALGRPPRFEVWCLARRARLSCDASDLMLDV